MDSEAQAATRVHQALAGAEQAVMVTSNQQLVDATEEWRQCSVVGLDTEFVRERTYRADLGLLQVSDGESAWLIDPLAVEDLDPLRVFMNDSSIEKVIHSGSEDFEVLHHQLGAVPSAAIDSQIACAMLGQSLQLGYHHAVKWLFEVEIEKDQTRSNWLRRPLTGAQCRYAALDVVLLPMMVERLRGELERLGRWQWLQEEVQRMANKSGEKLATETAWMRIGGAGSLDDDERTALSVLAQWREEAAQRKNLARGFVVPDAGLMALARLLPVSLSELETLEELHPKAINRYGEVWLDLIQKANSQDTVAPLPQLTQRDRQSLKTMKTKVTDTAKLLDVDAALIASRKQLEMLIFDYTLERTIPERFTGWRQEVITNDLLQILNY